MSWKFKIFLTTLILLITWIISAPLLAKNLIVEKPLKKADAILVLSGSTVYKERTRKAAKLYKQEVSKKILLTDDGGYAGWSKEEQRNPPFVYLAQQELILLGVAEEDIEILEPQVTGTIWEARNLKSKVENENWEKVLLVTSAYHTRRTFNTFTEVLGDRVKIGILSSTEGEPIPPGFTWWLTVSGWRTVAGEYLKSLVYWVYY